jgi:hypothetical protein
MSSVDPLNTNTITHRPRHSQLSLHWNTTINLTDDICPWHRDISCHKLRGCFKTGCALRDAVADSLVSYLGGGVVVESILCLVVQVTDIILNHRLAVIHR